MTTADDSRMDPRVVEDLYAAHATDLRAFLVGVLRDGELAGEALQSTFAKLLEVGHTTQESTRRGWLFRVAYHEAMAIKRRDKLDRKSRQSAWNVSRGTSTPLDEAARSDDASRVQEALSRLPPEQQQVVRMRIYENRTFADIAGQLEIPLGTVLTRMRLALKKLGQSFGQKP